jgi:hypothetical protein
MQPATSLLLLGRLPDKTSLSQGRQYLLLSRQSRLQYKLPLPALYSHPYLLTLCLWASGHWVSQLILCGLGFSVLELEQEGSKRAPLSTCCCF